MSVDTADRLVPGAVGWAERALQTLLEVTVSISSAGADSALNELARLALKASGADRCAVLVPDPTNSTILLPAAGASQGGDLQVLWDRFRHMGPIDVEADLHHPSLWTSSKATLIEDVETSDVIPKSWKRAWHSKSIAYVPMRASGLVLGVLAVDYVAAIHRFTEGEASLLEAIAGAAAVVLRGTRLVERLQHAVTVERRLSECTAALRSGGTLAEMLDTVADRFSSLLTDASCAINLVAPGGDSFRVAAFRGTPPRLTEIQLADLPMREVEEVRQTWERDPRRPIVVEKIPTVAPWRLAIPEDIGTGMLVPLVEGKEILGFVAVGRASGPFTDEEVRVAMAFADHAALAIGQTRMTDVLQVRLKLIESLYRLGDAVVRTSDLKSLLNELNREIGSEIGIECTRVCFGETSLADLLRVAVADEAERESMRRMRKGAAVEELALDGAFAFPVLVQHRVAGILWVRAKNLDSMRLELGGAIASAIGEIAYKSRLRRTAEQRAQELAIAADRERIARDLHDTVGQTFYGIGLKLQDLLYEVTDPQISASLSKLRVLASKGVADVRSAVYALSFLNVRDGGFIPSLRALVRQFTIATGVHARLAIEGSIPSLREEVENALYRMAHEALVNVERHARASGVVIRLRTANGSIELSIRDDGVGLGHRQVKGWQSSSHFGMKSMAKAIEEVGGVFTASAGKPRGLVIEGSIPLPTRVSA